MPAQFRYPLPVARYGRTERAATMLRAEGADAHLIEALERSTADLSEVARRLRQGTLFAVPKEQLNL